MCGHYRRAIRPSQRAETVNTAAHYFDRIVIE
jgi:hypothetical protein